jgi:hypothetical protein
MGRLHDEMKMDSELKNYSPRTRSCYLTGMKHCQGNLGGPVDSDYGKRPQSLSLLWARENDPERSSACLCNKHGGLDCPIWRASSMRFDTEVGTYLISKCTLQGEGMSFFAGKKLLSLLARSKTTRLLTMGLSYPRRNPIQLSKSIHPGKGKVFGRTKPFD